MRSPHAPRTGSASVSEITYSKDTDMVTLNFKQAVLPAGSKAQLHIEFTGCHNDSMSGFYRSKVETAKDEPPKWVDACAHRALPDAGAAVLAARRFMVVTQFEPTDARRAFPCWDEVSRLLAAQPRITSRAA
ncbi:MAG TPA: hypothetical protein VMF89_29100 [Polyangiales bacterium]|nr:hypothetical protein [Polyangiales bacterium]